MFSLRAFISLIATVSCALGLSGCAAGLMQGVKVQEDLSEGVEDISLRSQFQVTTPPKRSVPVTATVVPTLKNPPKRKQKGEVSKVPVSPPPGLESFTYPDRRPAKDPIWRGETLVYEVTWMGLKAGEFTTEVLPLKELGGRRVYHIKGTAKSYGLFAMVYRLEDYAETFMDFNGWFSHRFHLVQQESKQFREVTELYDHPGKRLFYWSKVDHKIRGRREVKEFRDFVAFSADSLSAIYYLRLLDLKDGQANRFFMVADGKSWEATAHVLGRVHLVTGAGKIRSIKIRPDVKYQGILQGSGESYIYLSDDDRKYCTRLEAAVKIGKFILDLKKVIPGIPPDQDPERVALVDPVGARTALARVQGK